jgi:hypothetical protein
LRVSDERWHRCSFACLADAANDGSQCSNVAPKLVDTSRCSRINETNMCRDMPNTRSPIVMEIDACSMLVSLSRTNTTRRSRVCVCVCARAHRSIDLISRCQSIRCVSFSLMSIVSTSLTLQVEQRSQQDATNGSNISSVSCWLEYNNNNKSIGRVCQRNTHTHTHTITHTVIVNSDVVVRGDVVDCQMNVNRLVPV